jgi:hypothetical protein
MPDSETFDAFYARTVGRITSQMHELAGNDGLADHAIREAYARAYQQWYHVSGYRDTEAWVLSTAQEAYERRRAEAGFEHHAAAAQAADSGTWPGLYRPRADEGGSAAGLDQPFDPDATVARQPRRAARRLAGNPASVAPAAGSPDYPAASAPAANYPPTGPMPPGRAGLSKPVSRRTALIAGSAIAALVIASVAYLVSGGHSNTPAASGGSSPSVVSKPKVQMLPAGKTGQLSAVPWVLVGQGWALAEFSTAQPNSAGQASGTGTYTTYLVDPEGGKYTITTSAGSTEPQLMAWSGDTNTALFYTVGASGGTGSYQLLHVHTGELTPLLLPAGVVALGFTRPDGQAILAVSEGQAKFRLQRYTLTGQLQASLAWLPRKSGETLASNGCASACALSSPDGLTDVWGVLGDGTQMLSNSGGKATRLHVKGSGHPSSCMPLSWWNDTTVLANCAAAGGLGDSSRLWLVPKAGSPTPLTAVTGSLSGGDRIEGAWQAGGAVYVTQTSSLQCPTAPSGPEGMNIEQLGEAGSSSTVTIPGGTGYVNMVVGSSGERLLVLAQTHCPGTSSLLWLNPSTGTKQIAVTAPSNEVGVIAAVPYGNGPTAVTGGDQ